MRSMRASRPRSSTWLNALAPAAQAPILQAAGLNPSRVRVLIVNDGSLNAFVIDNQTIFIHYGLIQRVEDPGGLQAVIAHEAAHISNGHIARRMAIYDLKKAAVDMPGLQS